jgi:hypothetical protein
MDKYGLTLDECLDLKKEILAQSDIKFPKQETYSSSPHQTNTQMLSQASAPRGQPTTTPKVHQKTEPKKLDPQILSHLGRSGQGK